MAYESFKPEFIANELMTDRHRESVFRNLTYKGPILGDITKKGDILHIAGVGRPTVRDYTQGSNITVETQDSYNQDLRITEQKYVAVTLDKIDQKQAQGEIMAVTVQEAKEALARTLDEFAAKMYSQAGSTVTQAALTSVNLLATLAEAQEKLLEADVPVSEEMILVVSPAVYTKIVLAKIAYQMDNRDVMTRGYKGNVLNFNTYVTNAIQNNGSTTDYCMAFTRKTLAIAEQIPVNMIEKFSPELRFEDAFKVLHLYGGTVIRPKELVNLTLTTAAEAS